MVRAIARVGIVPIVGCLLWLVERSRGWSLSTTTTSPISPQKQRRERSVLSVVSQEIRAETDTMDATSNATLITTEASKEALSSYAIERGDGSTGGGGMPMPNSFRQKNKDQDHHDDNGEELRRPKVGAEMPLGRPSWFRVPAPSQGEFLIFCIFNNHTQLRIYFPVDITVASAAVTYLCALLLQ